MKPYSDGRDISQSEWGFLPDQFSFVPGLKATASDDVHDKSSTCGRTRDVSKESANRKKKGPSPGLTDAAQNEADVDSLRKALKDSKGPGNFRNLFVYSPNGKKDGLQIIPFSEVTAKDEFNSIKNQTRDDILASLRIPPQLMGIVPQNAGGFGSIKEATEVWVSNELEPIQQRRMQLNDWFGDEVIKFKSIV